MKTITIDGEKYVSEADYNKKHGTTKPSSIKIAILQRGWVAIGRYSVDKNGDCHLANAKIIRTWGTTKGLGEIAENGPTPSTKLDDCPDISYHPMTAVYHMDVREEVWSKYF